MSSGLPRPISTLASHRLEGEKRALIEKLNKEADDIEATSRPWMQSSIATEVQGALGIT
jgi:hypothetical protein